MRAGSTEMPAGEPHRLPFDGSTAQSLAVGAYPGGAPAGDGEAAGRVTTRAAARGGDAAPVVSAIDCPLTAFPAVAAKTPTPATN